MHKHTTGVLPSGNTLGYMRQTGDTMPYHTRHLSPLQQKSGLSLSYRVREPAPATPSACVVLLHGVGGNPSNLADLAAAIDPSVLVVLPQGPIQLGAEQYAWFRVAFSQSGPRLDPAEADSARLLLVDFIAGLQATYGLIEGQVVIAGFSQGGIMSASVALSEPEKVCGFGILSGRILPELSPYIASRERLHAIRAFIGHGEQDDVLPVSWALLSEQRLNELGIPYESHRYATGHMLTQSMRDSFVAWYNALTETHFDSQVAAMSEIAPSDQAFNRTMRLAIGPEQLSVHISGGTQPPVMRTIDIGVESIARNWFKHEPPTALELERAIEVIEDALERLRDLIADDLRLLSEDKGVLEIAAFAVAPDQVASPLNRELVEQTFGRLADIVQGRPASIERLPESRFFAARLLILREFMHHMKFDKITLEA